MASPLNRPFFPLPPAEYRRDYFAEVVRSFSIFLEQVQNPGPLRATDLTLTDLQTDDVGLETGALFQQNGFVKVTQTNVPNVRGSSATSGLGIVTVTTS